MVGAVHLFGDQQLRGLRGIKAELGQLWIAVEQMAAPAWLVLKAWIPAIPIAQQGKAMMIVPALECLLQSFGDPAAQLGWASHQHLLPSRCSVQWGARFWLMPLQKVYK
jgi:hypothetical protein